MCRCITWFWHHISICRDYSRKEIGWFWNFLLHVLLLLLFFILYQLHLNVFCWHTCCMVALLECIVHETLFSCVWSLGIYIFWRYCNCGAISLLVKVIWGYETWFKELHYLLCVYLSISWVSWVLPFCLRSQMLEYNFHPKLKLPKPCKTLHHSNPRSAKILQGY